MALTQPLFSLDHNAVYSSPASAAHAVRQAVAGLVGPPPAALVLTAADLYPLEAVPANVPQWYRDLAGAGAVADAVTFETLSGATGQLIHLGLFEHVFFGRCLAASRDQPNSPVRQPARTPSTWCPAVRSLRRGSCRQVGIRVNATRVRQQPPWVCGLSCSSSPERATSRG